MYNLNSHYEKIYYFLQSIVAHPRVLYLHPYGSTQPENIEVLSTPLPKGEKDGPLFVFYDQEPIYGEFNYALFDHVNQMRGPIILITTEKDSASLSLIQQKYGWPVVYYFHHVFAAHDWFRGYKYDHRLVAPQLREINKKYITFNRLTSSNRVYRSLFISELIQRDILDQGHVSYNDTCPDGGNYVENITQAYKRGLISIDVAKEAIGNIKSTTLPLRIDYKDRDQIPNTSFILSAVPETQESFVYVVTETCYWEKKHHLTEKIFKPIVSKMPFILVGPAHNLKYLKEYGFKTFSKWFDESYDDIEDPIERMHAIGLLLLDISNRSTDDLKQMLIDMIPVLEHNSQLFNSQEFLDRCWRELTDNLAAAVPK